MFTLRLSFCSLLINMLTVSIGLVISVSVFGDDELCKLSHPQHQQVSVVGVARSLETDEFLYCEHHIDDANKKQVVVEYRDFNRELIAQKTVDYSNSVLSPNVVQEDFRHGELRQVKMTKSTVKAFDLSYRKANKKEIKQAQLAYSKSMVIDAGFDQAVRQSWDQLNGGGKVIVDFVSPIHLRSFSLTIKASDKGLCKKQKYNKDQQVCLLIGPSSRLASLFVKPLVLIYDMNSKRLVSFSGSVNITSTEGATLKAIVSYSYSDITPTLVDVNPL